MNSIQIITQTFKAKENLDKISTIIYVASKNKYGIDLDGKFIPILFYVMDNVINKLGRKPNTLSDQDHLNNLNQRVVEECLKYIESNLVQNKNNPQNISNYKNNNNDNLANLVETMAQTRGYNRPQDQINTPRVDFTLPMEKGIDPNQVMEKIKKERDLYDQKDRSINLNDVLGIPLPVYNQNNINNMTEMNEPNQYHGENLKSSITKHVTFLDNNQDNRQSESNDNPVQKYYELCQYNPNTPINSDISDSPSPSNINNKELPYQNQPVNLDSFLLSLDLRQDLLDIEDNKYIIGFKECFNITKIELISFMIISNEILK